MPAARYWRIARIETFAGGDLELSEVALYEGATRVDGAATVSAVVAPVSGSLTDLGDASFSTSARWAGDAVRLPGFAVVWDFGAGVTKDVTSVGVAGPAQATFAHKFALEYSSDGAAWARLLRTPKGSKYPGSGEFFTLNSLVSSDSWRGLVAGTTVAPVVIAYKFEDSGFAETAKIDPLPSSQVLDMAFSPDGGVLAVGLYESNGVTLYARDADYLSRLEFDASGVVYGEGLSFSHDGSYLAVAHAASPYLSIYKQSGLVFSKLANPSSIPDAAGKCVAFNHDSSLLVIGHAASPYVTVYSRSGDTFTKLSALPSPPTGAVNAVTFSPDGSLLAVSGSGAKMVSVYSVAGTTFTKLPDLPSLPGGTAQDAAFSPDGLHFAIGSSLSPYLVLYAVSGETFTLLPAQTWMPAATGNAVKFSPNSGHLAIGHGSSAAGYLSAYSISGDVFTKLPDPGVGMASNVYALAWSPSVATGGGLLPVNYDTTPLRSGAQAKPTMLGEDVAGFTQAFSAAKPSQLDIYDAGRGRITGTVKERAYPADIPVKRRVALLSMPGSRAIRETWSDSVTGEYEFAEIAMDRTYTVVSYDHTGTYMGEVADNVQPTLMA